ncbi:hypothetical protein VTL71DRAFT_12639 [Oculimacula yallundae]|uniref:Uncharacterized protein n=1 Tax=Oculimacula yallundae TaxID=86028 RepID=A0ABR4CQS4_9HELO
MGNSSVEDFLKHFGAKERPHHLGFSSSAFDRDLGSPFEPYSSSSTASTIRGTYGDLSQLSSSSSRGRSDSDSASQLSSAFTALSTAPSIPPFPLPPWHSYQYDMAQPDYDYELPCEFHMLGCYIKFHPEDYRHWIAHSLSHFIDHGPPSKTVCTFCDDPNGYIQDPFDPKESWKARMLHIGAHHRDHRGALGNRPDYRLLKHLRRCNLINEGQFESLMTFTERHDTQKDQIPYKELHLVDDDFQTPEMKVRARNSAILDDGQQDMKSERRRKRPEKEKGKGKERERSGRTHRSSRKADVHYS